MAYIPKVVIATFAGMLLLVGSNVAAVDYLVGDDQGWTNGFDYQQWAKDKVFKVGDRLVFQYAQGYHNVYKVDGKSFNKCKVPLQSQPLTSGSDIIELKTPGKKWYICGVDDHCSLSKQKLSINVMPPDFWWLPSSPPTIAPAPSPLDPVIALPPWFSWFPFGTPPTPAPAYGGYSSSKNTKKTTWPMPPSPDSSIPPFWIPDLPIGNAPSPSPYYATRDESRSNAEAPWMFPALPFPWIFPPAPATVAPSPDVEVSPWWPFFPFPTTPSPSPYSAIGDQSSTNTNSKNNAEAPWMLPTFPFPWMFPPTPAPVAPSPSYAMNEYSSDAYGLTGNMAQILMISIAIGLAMAGLL